MFCPKCAAQNISDAKFCRVCGADISLVPMALTGALQTQQANLVAARDESAEGKKQKAATPDQAIKKIFMGAAFLLIGVMLAISTRGGEGWWFWMLIPAFALIGDGIGTFVRYRQEQRRQLDAHTTHNTHGASNFPMLNSSSNNLLNSAPRPASFVSDLYSAPRTAEIVQPPSVTEGTTRLLEATPPTGDGDTASSETPRRAPTSDERTGHAS